MSTDPNMTETSGAARDRDLIAGARDQVERGVPGRKAPPSDDTVLATPVPDAIEAVVGDTHISIPGYLLKRKLSGGGQGVVYEAVQKSTKRRVAVKIVRGGATAHPENRKRLERGVRVLGQLHHPNIVGIIDTGTVNGCMYYVMEYVPGMTLDDYVAHQRATSFELNAPVSAAGIGSRSHRTKAEARAEKQSMHRLLTVFAKICEALDAAHLKGVIHRDMKPANILVDPRGEPHVLDFDLAKVLDGGIETDERFSAMTESGEFLGSLRWASPEQVECIPSGIDLRTDVYSLGVILFEMLTGQFPYPVVGTRREIEDNILHADPQKPRLIRKAIDDELETIVLKCLSKQAARRYRSAGELAADVRGYLNGDPISAKRDSGWYMFRKLAARHRATTIVSLSILAILVSAMTYVVFAWRMAENAVKRREASERQLYSAKSEIEETATRALQVVNERQFLWFLAEWEAGRMDRARRAASYFGSRSLDERPTPEALVASLLLGEIDAATFERSMPTEASLLQAFALAELNRREKHLDRAEALYNACRGLDGPGWLKREAAERLSDIEINANSESAPGRTGT